MNDYDLMLAVLSLAAYDFDNPNFNSLNFIGDATVVCGSSISSGDGFAAIVRQMGRRQ